MDDCSTRMCFEHAGAVSKQLSFRDSKKNAPSATLSHRANRATYPHLEYSRTCIQPARLGFALMSSEKGSVVCVSGITGFIGSQIVKDLLVHGYRVHGTARNISEARLQHISSLPGAEELFQPFEADLLKPGSFDNALAGCQFALHVASPYFMNARDSRKELVEPAVLGTRHFLESCVKEPSIQKVVVTSSVAAIADEGQPGHVFTENDWNAKSSVKRLPYYYGKTMAEKVVWEFAEKYPAKKFIVINPFIVIGPSLVPSLNESTSLLKDIIQGRFPGILDFTWTLVDVRDVSKAHLAALEHDGAAGRYICAAAEKPITMREMVHCFQERGLALNMVRACIQYW